MADQEVPVYYAQLEQQLNDQIVPDSSDQNNLNIQNIRNVPPRTPERKFTENITPNAPIKKQMAQQETRNGGDASRQLNFYR